MTTIDNIAELTAAVKNGFSLFVFTETLQDGKYILTHSEKITVNAIAFCPNNVTFYEENGAQIRIAPQKAIYLLTNKNCTIEQDGTVTNCFID